jgi:hypothetical protein
MSQSSARSLLLGRGARVERFGRDLGRAQLHGKGLGIEASAGACPKERGELEPAVLGPERHEADQTTQVFLWVDASPPWPTRFLRQAPSWAGLAAPNERFESSGHEREVAAK